MNILDCIHVKVETGAGGEDVYELIYGTLHDDDEPQILQLTTEEKTCPTLIDQISTWQTEHSPEKAAKLTFELMRAGKKQTFKCNYKRDGDTKKQIKFLWKTHAALLETPGSQKDALIITTAYYGIHCKVVLTPQGSTLASMTVSNILECVGNLKWPSGMVVEE